MSAPPIKILHVVFSLEVGGMENGLVNVARALPAEEFSIHVCCLERSGPFAERLPNPANVVVLDKQPGLSIPTVRQLRKTIVQLRPDVIHSHAFGPLSYTMATTALGCGWPIVHGEHGMLFPGELRPALHLARRLFYARARKVHTVSHGLKRHFVEHGFPAHRIEVIVNGVDTGRFSPGSAQEARKQIGMPATGQVIGIVGSFSPRKRHDLLFQAFDRLADLLPDLRLLVVGGGTGPWAEKVVQLAKTARAADRIHLAGIQKYPVTYYRAMDILAIPSVNEGLANAALESMASGVPVLAHNACGSTDVIDSGVDGLVENIESADQLFLAMKSLLDAPIKLTSMGAACRAKILRQFSLQAMVDGYARLYREALRAG